MDPSTRPNDDGLDSLMADLLAEQMSAKELRKWCRYHGIVRERGDSKAMTAKRAVEQNPVAVSRRVLGTGDSGSSANT